MDWGHDDAVDDGATGGARQDLGEIDHHFHRRMANKGDVGVDGL